MNEVLPNYKEQGLLFSIIIPVYNVKDYLEDAINSVLIQSVYEYEIVLIDDGSTDGSEKLCDLYLNKLGFINVIHQNNAGLSAARNTGINVSRGKYIIFLDADDKLCENALSELKKYIYNNSFPDVIAHRRSIFDKQGEGEPYPYLYSKYIGKVQSNIEAFNKFLSMPIGNIGAWNFTVKRSYFFQNSLFFYEGIYHEDEEWIPRLLLTDGKICFSDIVFYSYRIDRNDSITKNLNIKRLFDKLVIIDHLIDIFNKSNNQMKKSIYNRCSSLLFGVLCQMNEFIEEDDYNRLIGDVSGRLGLLRTSSKWVHKATYYFAKVFGISNVVNILNLISKERRKNK